VLINQLEQRMSQASKSSQSSGTHFRPSPVLAPKLGTSQSDYEQYLANYLLYQDFMESLKHDFWEKQKRVNEATSTPRKVVLPRPYVERVDHPTYTKGPDPKTVHHFRTHVRIAALQPQKSTFIFGSVDRIIVPAIPTEAVDPALKAVRKANKKARQNAARKARRGEKRAAMLASKLVVVDTKLKLARAEASLEKLEAKLASNPLSASVNRAVLAQQAVVQEATSKAEVSPSIPKATDPSGAPSASLTKKQRRKARLNPDWKPLR